MMLLVCALSLITCTSAFAQAAGAPPQKPKQPWEIAPKERLSKPFRFAAQTEELALDGELKKLLGDLDTLRKNWERATDRGVDSQGRPYTQMAYFLELRDDLTKRLSRKGGHLGWIVRAERSSARRAACYFGTLFVPETQDAFHLCRYLPYEPISSVRQQAIRDALPLLAHYLPQRGEQGRGFRLSFEIEPWVDLTRATSAADRILAFDVLSLVAKARPGVGAEAIRMMKGWIPGCLRAGHEGLADAVRRFLMALRPDASFRGDAEADVAQFERILRVLFPDIRLHGGICEIYPGPDRDKLAEVGEQLLRRSRGGVVTEIKVHTKLGPRHYQGIRLGKLPPPLDRLGFEEGDLLTHLNGAPITGHGALLKQIFAMLDSKMTQFVAEWVRNDKETHARRYVLR